MLINTIECESESESMFNLCPIPQNSKVATQNLSDREQKHLLYRRRMQFATGAAVPDGKSSVATKLSERKRDITKALKDAQAKNPFGALHQMMLQHLRETTNHLSFYSLPTELAVTLPIKEMTRASTSMLSVKGKPALPEGTLPLDDERRTLPLADRMGQLEDQPKQNPFVGPLEDDTQGEPTVGEPELPLPEHKLDLQQLVDYCQSEGTVVFKIADKNPHMKKRPLHNMDNILSADVAISFYRVQSRTSDNCLWVSPICNTEVPLVQFVSGRNPKDLIDHMWCWRMDKGSNDPNDISFLLKSFGRVFQKRVACPLALSVIDAKKNIKPTSFELYLDLSSKGWLWKIWDGKPGDLKRLSVNIDPTAERKVFYNGSYNYLLCLAVLPTIAGNLSNKTFLKHGQLESYYAAAFRLAQDSRFAELDRLRPDQSADFYRTQTHDSYHDEHTKHVTIVSKSFKSYATNQLSAIIVEYQHQGLFSVPSNNFQLFGIEIMI